MIKNVSFLFSVALALPFSLAACEKSAEEAQRAALAKQQQANQVASAAQAEANQKEREAERSAQKESAEAQNEAARKTAEAQRQAAETTHSAQAKADEAARAAAVRMNETYDQFTSRAERDLTDIERRATELERAAKQLDSEARAKTERVVKDVKATSVTIREEVKRAQSESGDALSGTKAKVERSLGDLKREVDEAPSTKR